MMKWQPRKKVGDEEEPGPPPAPPGRAAPAAAGGAAGPAPGPGPGPGSPPRPSRAASRTFLCPPAVVAPRLAPAGTPRGSGRRPRGGARRGAAGPVPAPLRVPIQAAGPPCTSARPGPARRLGRFLIWLLGGRSAPRARSRRGRRHEPPLAGPPFVGRCLARARRRPPLAGAAGRWRGPARAPPPCGRSRGSRPGRTFSFQRAWQCFFIGILLGENRAD